MNAAAPAPAARPPAAEVARRGDDIYERDIRPRLRAEDVGRVVAVDVTSGEYALADGPPEASRALRAVRPEAVVWLVRVGHRALRRYGRHVEPAARNA